MSTTLTRYLREYIFKFNELDENSIFRSSLGTQSLLPLKEKYIDFVKKIELLINDDGNNISTQALNQVMHLLSELNNIFTRTQNFSDIEFVAKRQGIYDDFNSILERFRDIWQTIGWIFIPKESTTIEIEIEKIQQINSKLQSDLSDVQSLKSSLELQLNDFKERYNDINVSVELEKQTNIFENQAEKNRENSQKWLAGIIISGIVLTISLICIYCNFSLPAQAANQYVPYNEVCKSCGEQTLWVDMIRHLFFKLLILSVEVYILTFCVKNYNACMHNKTNNEHRHNSFAAALHFYNTTTSERREEILIKVADAIFTYQKSGYYGKDSEPSNPSLIQNVVEKVSGKS